MMQELVSWEILKAFVTSRGVSIQWVDIGSKYWLKASDGIFTLECELSKSPSDTTDLTDFETNYKTPGNKPAPTLLSTFTAKTLPSGKKLYTRNVGIQAAVTTGSNTITYTATFPWSKLTGAEIIGGEVLDTIDFKVYDTAAGTYSGVPNALLNQFGYTVNVAPGHYSRTTTYDADVYQGLVLQLTYNSISNKTIGINLLLNEVK